MKKKPAIVITAIASILVLALGLAGISYAYFTDRDAASVGDVTAGFLEVETAVTLNKYGIPSDELAGNFVSITNNSEVSIKDIRLAITINTGDVIADYLLDTFATGSYVSFPGGVTTQFINNTFADDYTIKAANIITLDASLPAGATIDLEFAIKFMGESLVDGNAYQNKPINISAEIVAVQEGGDLQ